MFSWIKEKLLYWQKNVRLANPEIDSEAVLYCGIGKFRLPVAFLYSIEGKEYLYVFQEYRKYRSEIEKIFAEKRDNSTHIHVIDQEDLGDNFGSDEELFRPV